MRASQSQAPQPNPATPSQDQAPAAPQDSFTIGTYNVKNLFDKGNQNSNINTTAKPLEEIKAVFSTIESSGADVVALQEVENIKILNQSLRKTGLHKLYPHVVLVEGNDQRGIDVAVISKHPIKRVVSYKDREFPGPDNRNVRFCRDLLRVDLDLGGYPLSIYTTHLKSQIGGDPADAKRLAEATEMRKILEEDMRPFDRQRFVVTGDMNDGPESKTLKAIRGEGPERLASAQDGKAPEESVTYPGKKSQLDYILFPEHMQGQFMGSRILDNPDGSDHSMLLSSFRLGPPEPANQNRPPAAPTTA